MTRFNIREDAREYNAVEENLSQSFAKGKLASTALSASCLGSHTCSFARLRGSASTSVRSHVCLLVRMWRAGPGEDSSKPLGKETEARRRVSRRAERAQTGLAFSEDHFPGSVDRAEILKIT